MNIFFNIVHSGRDWQWTLDTKEPTYLKILSRFEDRQTAPFSIHQIALKGATEGKEVGQWFGPNTIAQVLKYEFEFKFTNSFMRLFLFIL